MRVQGLDFNIYVDVLGPEHFTSFRAISQGAMTATLAERAIAQLKNRYAFP